MELREGVGKYVLVEDEAEVQMEERSDDAEIRARVALSALWRDLPPAAAASLSLPALPA